MATRRLRLLLLVAAVIMSSIHGGGGEFVGQQPEGEGLEPADAGGYRTYMVWLATPSAAELKKFMKDGGGGEDDVIAAHRAWHQSLLPSTRTSLGGPRLLWSFHTGIYGFNARLTEEELKVVSGKPGFIHAYPDYLCSKDAVEF